MSQENRNMQQNLKEQRSLLKPVSWLAQLDFIKHLFVVNNVMLIAFSEKQGGKTFYTQFLQNNLTDVFDSYVTQCTESIDEKKIAIGLANHLNLANPDKTTISDICHQVNERNHHTLLILDSAHHLPDQQVANLLNIIKTQTDTPYFHLILVADYTLLPYLKQLSNQDSDDAIHSIDIGKFTRNEVKTYLHQNLNDEHMRSLINDDSCECFYNNTQGIISNMNQEMVPFFNSLAKTKRRWKKPLLAGSSLAVIILVGFVSIKIWQTPRQMYSVLLAKSQPSTQATSPLIAKPSNPLSSQLVKLTMPLPARHLQSNIVSIDRMSFQPIPKAEPVKLAKRAGREFSKVSTTNITKKSEGKFTNVSDANEGNSKLMAKASVIQRTDPPTITNKLESQLVSIQFGTDQLNKPMNPLKKYTIQLVATHQMKFLKALISKHPIANHKVNTYPITQNGEQWFILTVGQFTNWSDANDALAKLPPEYKHFQPWIRPIDKG